MGWFFQGWLEEENPATLCITLNLSIGDWVLCKRGLDGDNSYLKFLFNFKKRKLYAFQLHFMQLFSADAKIFFKKCSNFFCPPKYEKNSPQKLLIIPLDHQFSVQQVFALGNWDNFKVWNFLIFEVDKLCRIFITNILPTFPCPTVI